MKYKDVLQIKVTLKNFEPKIFRTFYFSGNSTFLELHAAIQEAMGWIGGHLSAFRKGRDLSIEVDFKENDFMSNHKALDISKTKLKGFLEKPKDNITYEYDFGDSWEHKVEVQKVFDEIDLPQLPFCIKGANACPIEDCGGVWGYAEIIDVWKNPKHPSYDEMNEWYDFENFEPFNFDIDDLNDNFKDFKGAVKYHKDIVKQMKQNM